MEEVVEDVVVAVAVAGVTCFAVRSASRRAVSSASPRLGPLPRRTSSRLLKGLGVLRRADRSLGGAPNRHCGAPFAARAPTRHGAAAAAVAAVGLRRRRRRRPTRRWEAVRSGEDPIDRSCSPSWRTLEGRRLCASSACSSWTRPVSARTRPSRRSVFRRSARSFSVGGASSAAPGVSRSSSAAVEAREGDADEAIWRPPMSTVFCSSVI